MPNKFQTLFEKPYGEIFKLIDKYVSDGDVVVDLGCGDGVLEEKIENLKIGCLVYGVDLDPEALSGLAKKKFNNINVKILNQNVNYFLETSGLSSDVDVVVMNAVIHETNASADQGEYLNRFFRETGKILKKGGKIIIGDYYYHPDAPNEEVEEYIERQKEEIGHADARNKFILPDLLISKARENGFSKNYSNEFRVVEEIDRRYYTFVFQKD
ncbi:MAG: methyltransferase domain-containing protein [Parcubacteria group bacterium]|jgi:SAM-dependent methyltransferase